MYLSSKYQHHGLPVAYVSIGQIECTSDSWLNRVRKQRRFFFGLRVTRSGHDTKEAELAETYMDLQRTQHDQRLGTTSLIFRHARRYDNAESNTIPVKTMAPNHLFDTNLFIQSLPFFRSTVRSCHIRCSAPPPNSHTPLIQIAPRLNPHATASTYRHYRERKTHRSAPAGCSQGCHGSYAESGQPTRRVRAEVQRGRFETKLLVIRRILQMTYRKDDTNIFTI